MENSIFCLEKNKNIGYIKSRLMSSTNLFTRLDTGTSRFRQSKTSKTVRAFTNLQKHTTLNNSKENLDYENYLAKVRGGLKFDEKKIVSKCLNVLRKEYDKITMANKQKKARISILRNEIATMRNNIQNLQQNNLDIEQKESIRSKALRGVKTKQDQIVMEEKILQNIIQRMKKDELYNRNASRLKEEDAKTKEKEAKNHDEMIIQWDDTIHKLMEKISILKGMYNKNSEQRVDKLADYEERIGCLQEKQKFQFQRKERTYELLSLQSNDIMDSKNVVMREVYMANKLLEKILKNKISTLLITNQKLQDSFHTIKTETTISDPRSLAKKFFSYSQLFQSLLSSISQYEKRQQELIEKNENLQQYFHEIENKNLQQEKPGRSLNQQFYEKKMEILEETCEKQLLMKKICVWVQKKIKLLLGDAESITKDLSVLDTFQLFCKQLKRLVQQIGQSKSLLEQKYQYGGIRLKKLVKETSIEDEKLRRSENQEMNESNIIESQYMHIQRQKIKKNQFIIKTHLTSQSKF